MWAVKNANTKRDQNGSLHPRIFLGGHLSNYESRQTGLNFGKRTRGGIKFLYIILGFFFRENENKSIFIFYLKKKKKNQVPA